MDAPTFTVAATHHDPKAALDWLGRAFSFEVTTIIDRPDDDPTMCHYEMAIEGRKGRIMVGGEWAEWARSPASIGGVNTQTAHVELAGGLGTHCERAQPRGLIAARTGRPVLRRPHVPGRRPRGPRVWTFAARVREVSQAEAEAAIGQKIEAAGWA
ncbi:MAG: hypothetical protein R2746_10420 [Acidimicrobiales bacterium]